MTHKCFGGCGTYINDNKKYCVSCERASYGEGGIVDNEETNSDIDDIRDEAGIEEE